MFRVGQKVVCIYHGRWRGPSGDINYAHPQYKQVYTILRFSDNPDYIKLVELSPIDNWLANHFRPVVSRPTSIAIFEAMLNPTEEPIEQAMERAIKEAIR